MGRWHTACAAWRGHRRPAGAGARRARGGLGAVAAGAYRTHGLTGVEVCCLHDIPLRNDLDAFPKGHGVPLEYTVEDFEREGQTSERLRQRRQAELVHPPSQ